MFMKLHRNPITKFKEYFGNGKSRERERGRWNCLQFGVPQGNNARGSPTGSPAGFGIGVLAGTATHRRSNSLVTRTLTQKQ